MTIQKKRIAVLGAGQIGVIIAGMLAEQGHEVTLADASQAQLAHATGKRFGTAVVDASDLGALLPLARAADAAPHGMPDVETLTDLFTSHPGAEALLDAIAGTESLRAAGVEAGLHHSTVQARAEQYSTALGFDIRSPRGRVRLSLALALHRLATTRFD